MSEERVDHELVEKWVEKQPLDVLGKLPDCEKRTTARDLITEAGKLAHELVETGGC